MSEIPQISDHLHYNHKVDCLQFSEHANSAEGPGMKYNAETNIHGESFLYSYIALDLDLKY
jgi:hypothetical protein